MPCPCTKPGSQHTSSTDLVCLGWVWCELGCSFCTPFSQLSLEELLYVLRAVAVLCTVNALHILAVSIPFSVGAGDNGVEWRQLSALQLEVWHWEWADVGTAQPQADLLTGCAGKP